MRLSYFKPILSPSLVREGLERDMDWFGYLKKILSFCCFLFFVFLPSCVSAMIVSPVLFDVQGDPGSQIDRVIELKNDTKQTVEYTLSSENFISTGEDGGQAYLLESSKRDLASWMSWSQPSVVVGPGSVVKVPIVINIPVDAEPGGHYATVFFSQGNKDGSESSLGMMQQVGVLFLARISGELTERASIESFELRAPTDMISHIPAIFDIRVRNEGSVHVRPTGEIVVTNLLGRVVAKIPFNQKQGAILPNGIRHFETRWGSPNDLEEKDGFWSELRAEWRGFAIGRYAAEIHATYGSSSQNFPKYKEIFWVFPWHLGLMILIGLVVLVVLIKIYNKCLICRMVAKSNAIASRRKTTRR